MMKDEKTNPPPTKQKHGQQQYPSTPPTIAQHPGRDEEQQQLLHSRRPCCTSFAAISCLFGAFLVLASLAVLFALSLTSLHDPTLTLASARVLAPIPSPTPTTNTTLGLDLLVCNPNGAAAFDHGAATTLLRYRGLPLGSVQAGAGRVPAKGCEHVRCELALDGLFLASGQQPVLGTAAADGGPAAGRSGDGLLGRIIDDAARHGGEVPFDAQARLQGTVHVLGVFRRKAVAAGTCHVVMKISVAEISVRRYTCSQTPGV